MKTCKEKMKYLIELILPGLEMAFKRGDKKYSGTQHNAHPRTMARRADEDIRHVRDLHVDVRLREAEDAADGGDLQGALNKIESAIGYLTILHYRTAVELDPDIDKVYGPETDI